jgi:hypothetical protein
VSVKNRDRRMKKRAARQAKKRAEKRASPGVFREGTGSAPFTEGIFYILRWRRGTTYGWTTFLSNRVQTREELSTAPDVREADDYELKLELACTLEESQLLMAYIESLSPKVSLQSFDDGIAKVTAEGTTWLHRLPVNAYVIDGGGIRPYLRM